MRLFNWLFKTEKNITTHEIKKEPVSTSKKKKKDKDPPPPLDWAKSEAHIHLLTEFTFGKKRNEFRSQKCWNRVLGEPLYQAVERFINERVITLISLPDRLDYLYSVVDLKPLLRERNLKLSGRKKELIERLIEADLGMMEKLSRKCKIYKTADEYTNLIEKYLKNIDERRQSAERACKELIKEQDFEGAAKKVDDFESSLVKNKVDSFGFGISRISQSKILSSMWSLTPKLLRHINDEKLKTIRIAAIMMELWGERHVFKWLPESFSVESHLEVDAIARMLLFHARHVDNLNSYKRDNFMNKRLWIDVVGDSMTCEACRKLDGKSYTPEKMIELPYEKCTCPMGCRCHFISLEEGEKLRSNLS